ncbi:lipid II:glycine glycyltransferase FemX [Sinomicrobium oceani]|uniref:lipid II:glycine glycyltransferase FemX n=1 Tax=Sinomicrobium oceani TaxID=1150368 RepID=UPI00227B7C45|nr:peptidoglycan bridge formation glycyltransferase FemA/FemB family protein [Sinomicrobium oceani]
MDFSVLSVKDNEWQQIISKSIIYDFHHTSCYHSLEANSEDKALLFVGTKEGNTIALPLLIRKIPQTDWYDATSAYGYCGPVASKNFDELSPEFIRQFQAELLRYLKKENIISAFSRLHPLMETMPFFNDFGQVLDLNKTIAIDLTLPLEEQRKDYRKSNKSEINQLKKKKGYSVREIHPEELKVFVEIYHQTMDRVEAKAYYYFDEDYFKRLLDNPCFNSRLLVAVKDGEIAAGAIFTLTDKIMQYHLAGTRDAYISDTPMKLILDEARLLGNELGLEYLHLGGGVGGSDEDSLYRFKSGFSKNNFQFQVWNLIVDQAKYDQLVAQNNVDVTKAGGFFPLYRA